MEWASTSTWNAAIDQLTYNVLSEMGVQPATPGRRHQARLADRRKPPWPSFTATPNSVYRSARPSASTRPPRAIPDGTITDYKWDFDNSGKFATDTGTTSTLTHTFTTAGHLQRDSEGHRQQRPDETTARTVNVANTATAKLSAAMNPVGVGQNDTLSAAGSSVVGGTIVDYKWDLDGNGTYETDTGSTPTVIKTFAEHRHRHDRPAGHRQQGRDRDRHACRCKVLSQGVSRYTDAVTAAPGLLHYYRFDEPSGPTIADSAGSSNGTLTRSDPRRARRGQRRLRHGRQLLRRRRSCSRARPAPSARSR